MRKSETIHPLEGKPHKPDPNAKPKSIISGALTFGRSDSNGRMSMQMPRRGSVASRFSTKDCAGELEVPGALEGPRSTRPIIKNATQKNMSAKKKPSRKTGDTRISAQRKDKEVKIPTELIKEHKAVF